MAPSASYKTPSGITQGDPRSETPETNLGAARGQKQGSLYASKLEARYAQQLDWRQAAGELTRWWYEALKLRLAARCWYTPDFLVLYPDGRLELHETKGFLRDDAWVKLKVAAEMYPRFRFRLVQQYHGQWRWTGIPK